jgi:transcriptional regulator with XRE-family HTH domain
MDLAGIFGDNLARCRRAAGLSQEELSYRASLHRTEISQLERGLRIARLDTVLKLAAVLEIDLNELVAGIEWTTPDAVPVGRFAAPEGER